mmetsp:Transcript_19270/g.62723  ORF Transcript_19270/g.62723 Transcript_19270/m.62723 type:complete len:239 (+) Transcript_19270:539-1255(+)
MACSGGLLSLTTSSSSTPRSGSLDGRSCHPISTVSTNGLPSSRAHAHVLDPWSRKTLTSSSAICRSFGDESCSRCLPCALCSSNMSGSMMKLQSFMSTLTIVVLILKARKRREAPPKLSGLCERSSLTRVLFDSMPSAMARHVFPATPLLEMSSSTSALLSLSICPSADAPFCRRLQLLTSRCLSVWFLHNACAIATPPDVSPMWFQFKLRRWRTLFSLLSMRATSCAPASPNPQRLR